MNCIKKISMTGYLVKYVDLREQRHLRTTYEEVYPIDKAGLEAINMMGVNVADFIESRYARGGYHAISVERITPKRSVTLDLHKLWDEAAPVVIEETPISVDGEVANG